MWQACGAEAGAPSGSFAAKFGRLCGRAPKEAAGLLRPVLPAGRNMSILWRKQPLGKPASEEASAARHASAAGPCEAASASGRQVLACRKAVPGGLLRDAAVPAGGPEVRRRQGGFRMQCRRRARGDPCRRGCFLAGRAGRPADAVPGKPALLAAGCEGCCVQTRSPFRLKELRPRPARGAAGAESGVVGLAFRQVSGRAPVRAGQEPGPLPAPKLSLPRPLPKAAVPFRSASLQDFAQDVRRAALPSGSAWRRPDCRTRPRRGASSMRSRSAAMPGFARLSLPMMLDWPAPKSLAVPACGRAEPCRLSCLRASCRQGSGCALGALRTRLPEGAQLSLPCYPRRSPMRRSRNRKRLTRSR